MVMDRYKTVDKSEKWNWEIRYFIPNEISIIIIRHKKSMSNFLKDHPDVSIYQCIECL